jgi:hypothetical protein
MQFLYIPICPQPARHPRPHFPLLPVPYPWPLGLGLQRPGCCHCSPASSTYFGIISKTVSIHWPCRFFCSTSIHECWFIRANRRLWNVVIFLFFFLSFYYFYEIVVQIDSNVVYEIFWNIIYIQNILKQKIEKYLATPYHICPNVLIQIANSF